MPLYDERREVALVFSGEDFPEPDLLRSLKERGHTLGPEGLSYLVHVYEEDPHFPVTLNGRFHGFLADRVRGTLMLFNDRYGMQRIYYHEAKDAFYFAAEAKCIVEVCPALRVANPRSLGELVACGCTLENRTLFDGIHVLPPGALWTFRDGSLERKRTYFQPQEWENQAQMEPEAHYQALRAIVSKKIPQYFTGSSRIGMSLTGGLDTRAIMAWHQAEPKSLPCYTFGGMFRDCRDVRIARKVAQACHQEHQVIRVGQSFLSRFPQYAERTIYLADGCTDVSHSPDLFVNEEAAKIAPTRMTGNYGDEVLRRLRVFKPTQPVPGLFRSGFLSYVTTARLTYDDIARGHALSFAVFRQAPWHHYGLLALEQTQLSVRTPFLDNELVRNAFQAPASAYADNTLRLRLIGDGNHALSQIPTDLGFGIRPGAISQSVSRQLHQFTHKAEYAYDYGMPQWVARIDHFLSPFHLERLFLGRHKFYHFRVWYRDVLSTYVQEMLLDPRTLSRPYLDRTTLEAIVRAHVKGNRNYTSTIHKVLTLELVHRLFLDRR
jgi:asparagine synthase (glutamine-hydrolysing)